MKVNNSMSIMCYGEGISEGYVEPKSNNIIERHINDYFQEFINKYKYKINKK